ncbi:MAG: arylsulfotransferase family protein [Solirubrobacteraceae bacterium]
MQLCRNGPGASALTAIACAAVLATSSLAVAAPLRAGVPNRAGAGRPLRAGAGRPLHAAGPLRAGGPESVAVTGSAGSYVSAPALHPAKLNVDVARGGRARGLIFLDPFAGGRKPLVGEEGAEILQEDGQPVWTHTAGRGEAAVDFEAQTYRRKPVLTWWQGNVAVPPRFTNLPTGSPEPGARYYVYNDHYQRIKTVYAKGGWTADLHEFRITPRNTALFIAYKTVRANLTRYGGSAEGSVEDAEIQEVSLETGKVLFRWNMLAHVPLSESEVAAPPSGIWDAYHMNSVQELPGGRLLVSARNTWAVYEISRKGGTVLWRLGGRHSSFKVPAAGAFYWQHDARLQGGDTVSIFDDGCCNLGPTGLGPAEQQSHGLVLELHPSRHSASVVHRYFHAPQLHTPSQGDVQRLGNGNVMVGWGQLPYLSEYSSAGKLLYAASLPEADESYRALRFAWTGMPLSKPSVAAIHARARTKVYMSWNGATAVRRWAVLAGSSPVALRGPNAEVVARAKRSGFETSVTTKAAGPYFAVEALSANGRVLASSKAVRVGAEAKGEPAPPKAKGEPGSPKAKGEPGSPKAKGEPGSPKQKEEPTPLY